VYTAHAGDKNQLALAIQEIKYTLRLQQLDC